MSNEEPQDSKKIRVFYQYGPFHRTIFVGGAWAGLTPNGLVQLALFNDLRPMPEMVTHGVVDDKVGPEIEKLERQGVVREVEATLLMSSSIASSLIPLIKQLLDQLEALQATQKAQAEEPASE